MKRKTPAGGFLPHRLRLLAGLALALLCFGATPTQAQAPYMVKDINPNGSGITNSLSAIMGDHIYFFAQDGSGRRGVWKSDGTAGGTSKVVDHPETNFSIEAFCSINGALYYSAWTYKAALTFHQMYKSDGTDSGTVLLREHSLGGEMYSPYRFVDFNGKAFFFDEGSMWKTDGTPQGTEPVKYFDTIYPDTQFPYRVLGGVLYFSNLISSGNYELWKSDGTEAGTVLITTMDANKIGVLNGLVYFQKNYQLWKSDGTPQGTVMALSDPRIDVFSILDGFDNFLLLHHNYLWQFDGNNLTDVSHRIFTFREWVRSGNKLFFAANDSISGYELWSLDLPDMAFSLVKDIRAGSSSSYPQSLLAANGYVFFSASDDVNGRELWRSDGTEEGTVMVANLAPDSWNSDPKPWGAINGRLLFTASAATLPVNTELWAVDLPAPVPVEMSHFTVE